MTTPEKHSGQWVAGVHAVMALIRNNPSSVLRLLVQTDRQDSRLTELIELALAADIQIEKVSRRRLDEQVGPRHQGITAQVQRPETGLREKDLRLLLDGLPQDPFLLVLDEVTDPHNLGACLRSADAAGVDAVIIPKDRAASLTLTVRRVASGAAESTPLVVVTNLHRTLSELKERGIWVCGTADTASKSLYEQDLTGPLALLMGSEGRGLRRLSREACDFLVSIPMAGQVSSLNVSVAAGVCLFEAVRQRLAVSGASRESSGRRQT